MDQKYKQTLKIQNNNKITAAFNERYIVSFTECILAILKMAGIQVWYEMTEITNSIQSHKSYRKYKLENGLIFHII
jgi:hypothetical protein